MNRVVGAALIRLVKLIPALARERMRNRENEKRAKDSMLRVYTLKVVCVWVLVHGKSRAEEHVRRERGIETDVDGLHTRRATKRRRKLIKDRKGEGRACVRLLVRGLGDIAPYLSFSSFRFPCMQTCHLFFLQKGKTGAHCCLVLYYFSPIAPNILLW